jgi:hypothetical protein
MATPGAATTSDVRLVATPSSPYAARRAPAPRSSPLLLTTPTSPSTRMEPPVSPSRLQRRHRSRADTLNPATAPPFGRAFASLTSIRRRRFRLFDRRPRRRLLLLLLQTFQRAFKPQSKTLIGLGGPCNSNVAVSSPSPAPSPIAPMAGRWRPNTMAPDRHSSLPSPPPWASRQAPLSPQFVTPLPSPCGTTATAPLTS